MTATTRSQIVAANVRLLRNARGWTQSRLAEDMAGELGNHRDPTAITRIEKGNRAVTLDEAYALATVFGLTVDQLVRLLPRRLESVRRDACSAARRSQTRECLTDERGPAARWTRASETPGCPPLCRAHRERPGALDDAPRL